MEPVVPLAVDESPKIRRTSTDNNVGDTTFTPRTYQVELLEAALKQNTIVCLQTGTGKTFIAVMLIKELAHQIRRAYDEGGKRTLFLVNTVPLVNQQAEVIKKHTNLEVGMYVGAMNVDLWKKDQWLEEFQKYQVLVMTCQIFKDILQHGYMGLSKVNLMVFDECHHAVKNHPYREIMRFFDVCPKADYPHVMGLTASILNGKCEPQKLEDKLCELELTLRSTAETANDVAGMSRYGTRPKEYILHCGDYKDESGLFQEIGDILTQSLNFFNDYGGEIGERERDPRIQPKQAISECYSTLRTIGPLGVKIVVPMLVSELEKLEKHEYLELNRLFIQCALTSLKWVKMLCDEKISKKDQTSLEFVPHKVVRLLEALKEFRPNENMAVDEPITSATNGDKLNRLTIPLIPETNDPDEDSDNEDFEPPTGPAFVEGDLCGVVFVEKRYTAAVLNKLLRHFQKSDPNLQHVKSDYITGQGRATLANRSIQTETQFKKQEEILRRFRRHETNLLFATSVIEEGVDVPRCNVVVRFDLPQHYRSYTQSKGRARAADSYYIMLTDEAESGEFQESLQQFREIDKILQRRCHNREPHAEEIMDMHVADHLLPPYMPCKQEGAPRVSMTSAISLVNRYCAKLPGDSFTHLTPQCKVRQVNEGIPPVYQATLNLPINAPHRAPIIGVEMHRKKYAQMAVALKTIELLHKQGELSDRLLPIEKNAFLESENYGYKGFEAEFVEGQARPGTTKRRQYYNKQVAVCLQSCHPDACKRCYLYAITMETKELLPNVLNTRRRKLHRPEDSPQCFGILTSKPIPRVPGFPIYTRSGQIAVTIDTVDEDMLITKEGLRHCQRFHCCMFSEVLRLQKGNLAFEPTSAPSAYLIVPLISDGENENVRIDLKFLKEISRHSGALDMPSDLPEYGSRKFDFVAEQFERAVVAPVYRNVDQPQRFYVAEISKIQNVSSNFPSDKFRTFADYYFEQYDIQVTNFKQPLLDVDSMASRLNLLTPRYLNHKGKALPISTGEKKAASQKQQLLVPEFCYIYPINAALWRKCICLPSILYRMNSLLIAEELRLQISDEAGIGVRTFVDYPFPNLTFGWEGLNMDGPSDAQLEGQQNGLPNIEEETSVDQTNHSNQSNHSTNLEEGEIDPLDDFDNSCKLDENLEENNEPNIVNGNEEETKEFMKASLEDYDCEPSSCIGSSPATILQALTMSNANDGFNLERLEMLGDSFLKQAVTIYLYCMYPKRHEGKLSFMRSKQVSNFNLYCLGKRKDLPLKMIMTLFDPASNWLPPGFIVEKIAAVDPEMLITEEEPSFPIGQWDPNDVNTDTYEYNDSLSDLSDDDDLYRMPTVGANNSDSVIKSSFSLQDPDDIPKLTYSMKKPKNPSPDLPYEIHTQQGLSDKSIADCIEALIGCYLVSCGSRNTLLFMSWLGLKVLPAIEEPNDGVLPAAESEEPNNVGNIPINKLFGTIEQPPSPFLSRVPYAQEKLTFLLNGFDQFEEGINYTFKDKSYLLQAFTHASYHKNHITDCYQRLEFLGDAILDYLITCHLYNNHQQLSPGALTDMRSALVNNNIFASLAVKFEYHKYFKAFSPELFSIVDKFVEFLNKKDDIQGMDSQLTMDEADEEEEGEDIEVPKALGDIFESVAGAIYLDSGMSLKAVWDVYYNMMRPQIEKFACELPISPVRELLEMEPETAKFGKPVRTVDGKTRVTVSVAGKNGKVEWKGVGRNYRIAKATAARRALRHLKNSKNECNNYPDAFKYYK